MCSPGSHAPTARRSQCVLCDPGSYQDEFNATACKGCGVGYFCPTGASIRLAPTCEPGMYANATDADGHPECFACPPGFACVGGAARPPRPGEASAALRLDLLCIDLPRTRHDFGAPSLEDFAERAAPVNSLSTSTLADRHPSRDNNDQRQERTSMTDRKTMPRTKCLASSMSLGNRPKNTPI